MRVHHKRINKVLWDLPVQGEQWQMWLAYHQQQMSYFQANRQAYLLLASTLTLGLIVSWCLACISGNPYVWIIAGLTLVAQGAVWYYLWLYNDLLHQMEQQTEDLFDKTISIETRPNLTMAKHVVDVAAHLVSGWVRRARAWREENDD